MEQPYVYTVDGKPDQMEHSLTRFTLGQTEGSSTKSYDEYGMLLSVRTDGMAFFNQDNTLIGINLADDKTVSFTAPADEVTLIQKQGNTVFASYDNGSFYIMDARTGAAAGRLDTGLSYNYFGNIITDGTTLLVHFEQKCFAVSIPESLLQ
ncbi:hypothetical protein NST84_16135 [Paenibacillus sp. FSL R7-0345]|uniref:hypothetical protein n=1 Tax=Paenibacillus sp. FSL R7-0345 TaxID=2954535 RepID=UPI00315A5386